MSAIFESPFAIRDRVTIDGCDKLTARVTAVLWREANPLIEVSWIDGPSRTAWIEPWRLELAES